MRGISISRKEVMLILGGLVIGAGLGIGVLYGLGLVRNRLPGFKKTSDLSQAPEVHRPAPDFTLETLAGESIRLADLRGRPLLLNFWATWCGPCRDEMPTIQARYDRLSSELSVLAVNFDESVDIIQPFVADLGLSFPILLDPGGKVQGLYRVRGYPTTFFIDSDGIIRFQHIGLLSAAQLDEYLAELGVGE